MGAAMLHPADTWALHVPRGQLDAWAALVCWHELGEHVTRLTEEMEEALLEAPPDPATPLASTAVRREAIGIQMPDRSEWLVMARIPALARIPVHGAHHWGYRQPVIAWCGSSPSGNEDGYISGYINLLDQPTLADVRISGGLVTSLLTEESRARSAADLIGDDYRVSLALAVFLRQP